jgi:hypothetical protein
MSDTIVVIDNGVRVKSFTHFAFRQLFTPTEQVAIDNYETGSFTAEQKANLKTIAKNFDSAQEIVPTDPRTIAGVQYYESIGLIAPGRSAQILA